MVVDEASLAPPLLGLCAGYERGEWRCEPFAEYLMECLVDFVYTEEEQGELTASSMRRALRRAAQILYRTDKYGKRGEFGELLLHVVLREHFGTLPAIRKIYFKDSPNDTVKGFDAVHVVGSGQDLELWLGEVKFYEDLRTAVRDVAEELRVHAQTDYLRSEFTLIMNKVSPTFPHRDRLAKLLDPTTSLDEVFDRARIPVLLTYDSTATASFDSLSQEYAATLRNELMDAHERFCRDQVPVELVVTLIMVPLATKQDFVKALHGKLEGMQR